MIATRAAVLNKPSAPLRIQELHLSEISRHDVLLRVISTGVCHSDYHLMRGESDSYRPIILGHELLAKVEAVGSDVTAAKPGDIVVAGIIPPCGKCESCRKGFSSLCDRLAVSVVAGPQPDGQFRWFSSKDEPVGQYCFLGGFSERVLTHENQLFTLPPEFEHIPEACLLGCAVPSGAGAVFNLHSFSPGSSVAIIGAGGVGCSALLGALAAGASRILCVDPLPARREMSKILGASDAMHPDDAESASGTFEFTFECVGSQSALSTALRLTKKCGTCVSIGMPGYDELCSINLWDLVTQQKTLVGSVHGSGDFGATVSQVLALWRSGHFDFTRLVTHKYALEQVNEAFSDMVDGRSLRGIIMA